MKNHLWFPRVGLFSVISHGLKPKHKIPRRFAPSRCTYLPWNEPWHRRTSKIDLDLEVVGEFRTWKFSPFLGCFNCCLNCCCCWTFSGFRVFGNVGIPPQNQWRFWPTQWTGFEEPVFFFAREAAGKCLGSGVWMMSHEFSLNFLWVFFLVRIQGF